MLTAGACTCECVRIECMCRVALNAAKHRVTHILCLCALTVLLLNISHPLELELHTSRISATQWRFGRERMQTEWKKRRKAWTERKRHGERQSHAPVSAPLFGQRNSFSYLFFVVAEIKKIAVFFLAKIYRAVEGVQFGS